MQTGHEPILKEESRAEEDLTRVSFATPLARFDGRPLTFQEIRPLPGVSVEGRPAGWERRHGMKAEDVTAETLPKALQIMRLAAELTQVGLSRRTTRLDPPFKRVTPNQISDFERGFKRPSSVNLLSIVVGCSSDGETLDLALLQAALEKAVSEAQSFSTLGGVNDPLG